MYSVTMSDLHFLFQAQADVVKSHLESNRACSKQLLLKCPMCVNNTCGQAKQFFSDQQVLLDTHRQQEGVDRAMGAQSATA